MLFCLGYYVVTLLLIQVGAGTTMKQQQGGSVPPRTTSTGWLETSIQRLLSSINGLLLFMLLIMRGFYCNCLLKLTMNHVYTLHDYNEVLFVHIFVL